MISLNNYLRAAAEIFNCSPADIMGDSRWPNHVDARHCVFYQLRTVDKLKHKEIGLIVGRHHTTVIFGVNRVKDLSRIDRNFKAKFSMFNALLDLGLNAGVKEEIRLRYCSGCDKNVSHELFCPRASQCKYCRSAKSKLWRENFKLTQDTVVLAHIMAPIATNRLSA